MLLINQDFNEVELNSENVLQVSHNRIMVITFLKTSKLKHTWFLA